MADCEMCGKSTELVLADIEGVELKVCDACARFGIIRRKVPALSVSRPVQREEPSFKVVDNYAVLLRTAREKKSMAQEDFAQFISEKKSVLAHWESGQGKPSLDAAKRMGRILGTNLIEQEEALPVKIEAGRKTEELTLGDFVKVRKRR